MTERVRVINIPYQPIITICATCSFFLTLPRLPRFTAKSDLPELFFF